MYLIDAIQKEHNSSNFFTQSVDKRMRRCVVTGGSGFLGRHLIDALLRKYAQLTIVVFDLHTYVHDDDQQQPVEPQQLVSVAGDVTHLGDLVSAFRDADCVFHCVSADPTDNTNKVCIFVLQQQLCALCSLRLLIHIELSKQSFERAYCALGIDVDSERRGNQKCSGGL